MNYYIISAGEDPVMMVSYAWKRVGIQKSYELTIVRRKLSNK